MMNADYSSRPKSSHGRSNVGQRHKPSPVRQSTENSNISLRPKSSRGRNRNNEASSFVNLQTSVLQGTDSQRRPRSSRGRHNRNAQVSPDNVEHDYSPTMNQQSMCTSTAHRPINNTHTYYQPLKSDESTYTVGVESERPKSSRGRPIQGTDNDGYEPVQQSNRRTRPKSAKGRARTPGRVQPSYHNEQPQDEADILVLDESNGVSQPSHGYPDMANTHAPVTKHVHVKQNSNHAYGDSQIQASYEQFTEPETLSYEYEHQAQYEQTPAADSPQNDVDIADYEKAAANSNETYTCNSIAYESSVTTTFRPTSGRSSARPTTASERKQFHEGANKDNDFLRAATGTPLSARPDSVSSFSRHPVLPSIGLQPVPVQHNAPTRIPSAYREPIRREQQYVTKQMHPPLTSSSVQSLTSSSELFPSIDPLVSDSMTSLSLNQTEAANQTVYGTHALHSGDTFSDQYAVHGQITHEDMSTKNTAENNTVLGTEADKTAPTPNVPTFPPLTREIRLPTEPKADENSLLLAIKLPDGKRVQRYFLASHTLNTVLNFAEFSSQMDFTGTEIICDAPRKVFSDMSIKLCDSGLKNRTVIHIQNPDT